MQVFTYIVIISFVVRTIRNTFYQIYLWQLKEYRLDRLITHLKTTQGKKLIFGYLTVIKWILFLGILSDKDFLIDGIFYFLFWLTWVVEAVFYLRELILYRWRLPRFTLKTIFILATVFFVLISILVGADVNLSIGKIAIFGPMIDRFIWLLIFIVVFLFDIPVFLYKQVIIYKAKNKLLNFPNLTVIGITGSYGKTSTKEFLATILSEKYKVAKTPGFTNTDIGIANYILKELKPDYEIFIVEMGAYKRREIKAICDMVRPKMGIITGINAQHLELFGSIENTIKAKFELIESLPKGAIAIFNGNNPYCLQMAKWAESLKVVPIVFKTSANVKNIKLLKDHIDFNFTVGKKSYLMKANLSGVQAIENILAAIHAARSLGMEIAKIQKGVARITPPAKTMQIAGTKTGTTFIDDTFNANPDGVIAAISYMKQYRGKKILVLTPLIELGEAADKIHRKIGKEASKVCDLILLTNMNYRKSFIDGAKETGKEEKIQIVNTLLGTKLIEDNLTGDGVVIFEGKEAGRILDKLLYV